jgi:hypothetical protein
LYIYQDPKQNMNRNPIPRNNNTRNNHHLIEDAESKTSRTAVANDNVPLANLRFCGAWNPLLRQQYRKNDIVLNFALNRAYISLIDNNNCALAASTAWHPLRSTDALFGESESKTSSSTPSSTTANALSRNEVSIPRNGTTGNNNNNNNNNNTGDRRNDGSNPGFDLLNVLTSMLTGTSLPGRQSDGEVDGESVDRGSNNNSRNAASLSSQNRVQRPTPSSLSSASITEQTPSTRMRLQFFSAPFESVFSISHSSGSFSSNNNNYDDNDLFGIAGTSNFFSAMFNEFVNSTLEADAAPRTRKADPEQVRSLKRRKLDTPAEQSSFNCCICLEDGAENSQLLELPCRHELHSVCAETYFETNHICPLCRYPLRTTDAAYNRDYVARAIASYEEKQQEQRQRQQINLDPLTQQRLARCAMQAKFNCDNCALLEIMPSADQVTRISPCDHLLHKECVVRNASTALDLSNTSSPQSVVCPYCSAAGRVQLP